MPGAGRFLLLAALLLGIVTMHTLGHPREHGPSAERATTGQTHAAEDIAHARVGADGGHARVTTDGKHAHVATGDKHARVATDGGHAEQRANHKPAHGTGEHTTTPPSPHDPGMDPLSLCLAVLGAALTLALLYAAVHQGPWGTPVHVHRLARVLDTLRPNPPPPRTLLAHLSVLRV